MRILGPGHLEARDVGVRVGRNRLSGGEAALKAVVADDGLADPGLNPELRPGIVDGLDHGVELVLQPGLLLAELVEVGVFVA